MAGERKGITYEAFVKIALDELVSRGTLIGTVFWNEKPEAMTIEPDFTVGRDKDHPTHVFLVSHSGSAGDSHKKFWRNIGELTEVKVRLPKPAHTYTIIFDAVIKPDIKALQAAAFDGQLLAGDSDYGRRLLQWVDAHSLDLPKDAAEKVAAIRDAMKDRSQTDTLRRVVANLTREIGTLVQTSRTDLDALWKRERTRPTGKSPQARDTFLRQGIGKLALFPEIDDVGRGGVVRRDIDPRLVESLKLCGILGDSIAGVRLVDRQALWALNTLSPSDLRALHRRARALERMSLFATAVAQSRRVLHMHAYCQEHPETLRQKSKFAAALRSLHADPTALIDWARIGFDPPGSIWLLEHALEILRLRSRLRASIGYAKLGQDVQAAGYRSRSGAGNPRVWGGGYAIISDWVLRRETEEMPDEAIDGLADVLARHLKGVDFKTVDPAALRAGLLVGIVDNRLVSYSSLDPTGWLLEARLPDLRVQRIRGAFAERSGVGGQSGQIEVGCVGSTIINWQSAHGSHTNDKRKELSGRAPALRYSWDEKDERFVSRRSAKRLFLVVDGTWGQSDLDSLALAGWDEIFYPDDVNDLVKAVV